MSWEIVLFNSMQKIESPETLDENELMETDFDGILLDSFKSAKIEDNNVDVETDLYALNFFLDEDSVSNKMITLYNENALFEIIRISKKMKWQIYDAGIDSMIDLENPEVNGYESFQKYLNQILGK